MEEEEEEDGGDEVQARANPETRSPRGNPSRDERKTEVA